MSAADGGETQVALVIVAQAEYEHWERLTEIIEAVDDLRARLAGSPYVLHLPELQWGGKKADVEAKLGAGLEALGPRSRLVLYWVGHGTSNGTHYLVTQDSPRHVSDFTALTLRSLGSVLAGCRAEKVLAIIDTCYSSGGVPDVATEVTRMLTHRLALPGQLRLIAVLPSVHAFKKAQAALLTRALAAALTGSDDTRRSWTDSDELIRVSELAEALVEQLSHAYGPDWQPPQPFVTGVGDRFLPNPRFVPDSAAIDVDTRRRLRAAGVGLPSGGGLELGGDEVLRDFTGRVRVLAELDRVIADRAPGVTVLTSPPGAGKSAVLAKLVTDARERIGVAVHAKGLNIADMARILAADLELPVDAEGPQGPARVVDAVAAAGDRRAVLVLDALDEARAPREVASFLRSLAEQASACVLVGSRTNPGGGPARAGEDAKRGLRALLGEDARVVDLGAEPDSEADIDAYVNRRLQGSPHVADPDGIVRVAAAVARKAEGSFLYARVVTLTLEHAESLDGPLPPGPVEAFLHDLATRFGESAPTVDGMLAGLAWGQGAGLSRSVWPRVASAVLGSWKSYTDADTAWVLDHAGWYVFESSEAGQTVYRLMHQSLTEHYRAQVEHPFQVQRRIAEGLAS